MYRRQPIEPFNASENNTDGKANHSSRRLRIPMILPQISEGTDALQTITRPADEILGQQLALETERRILIGQLEKDNLTGIPNEQGFRKQAAEKLEDPDLRGVTLIVIDLNDFKWINDTFGHQFGDALLIQFADALEATTRKGFDIIARWHGDEFLILVPEYPADTEDTVTEEVDVNRRSRKGADTYSLERKIEANFKDAVLQIMNNVENTYNLDESHRDQLEYYLSRKELTFDDGTKLRDGPVGFGIKRFDISGENVDLDLELGRADEAMYERKKVRKAAYKREHTIEAIGTPHIAL